MNRAAAILFVLTLVAISALLICRPLSADPGVPPRLHACITHAGDFQPQVEESIRRWGQYASITDCGHVPVTANAPYPDVTVKCISDPDRPQGGVTYPYTEYAYVVIFHCDEQAPDFQTLIDHEMGHALGLDHSPTANTLMSPRQEPPLPIHGPFTCEEARRIAVFYPPGKDATCSEPVGADPPISLENDIAEFSVFGKWDHNCLTHRADPALEQLYVQAFAVWTAVANIRDCGPVTSGEDILIRVNTTLPGNTAGQCAWSISGGIIRKGVIDIKVPVPKVTAHELGHCIGLGHSSIPQALMFSFCTQPCIVAVLHADDIAAIQSLYGPAGPTTPTPPPVISPTPTRTPTPTPTRTPIPNLRFLPQIAKD